MILVQNTSTVVERDAPYLVPRLRDLAFSVDIRYPHYIAHLPTTLVSRGNKQKSTYILKAACDPTSLRIDFG